jgi:hypothetical protein
LEGYKLYSRDISRNVSAMAQKAAPQISDFDRLNRRKIEDLYRTVRIEIGVYEQFLSNDGGSIISPVFSIHYFDAHLRYTDHWNCIFLCFSS